MTTAASVPPLAASRTFGLLIDLASPAVSIISATGTISGHRLAVKLHCTEAACSGRASAMHGHPRDRARGQLLLDGPGGVDERRV